MANQLATAIHKTPNIKRQRYFQKYLFMYLSEANFNVLTNVATTKVVNLKARILCWFYIVNLI